MRTIEPLLYGNRLVTRTEKRPYGARLRSTAALRKHRLVVMLVFCAGLVITFSSCMDGPVHTALPESEQTARVIQEHAEIGMKWWIKGDSWFGCADKAEFEKLVETADRDDAAFESVLTEGLRNRTATAFQHGEQVYVLDDSVSGMVKVLRKRDAVEYWTDSKALSKSRLPPPIGSVEIVSFRLVPWTNPQGHVFKQVLVNWRNTGKTNVRAVRADVLGYDSNGNLVDWAADYTIFTVWSDRERGVPSGAVYREPEGEGKILLPETQRVEVRIAHVFELSGMDSEYDESEADFRARMEELRAEAEKAAAIEAAKWRVWTAANGKHTLDAKFVKAASGKLTLEKRDGSTVVVDLGILCEDDQEFVISRRWLEASEDRVR